MPRTILKGLHAYLPQLQSVKAKLKVRAAKDAALAPHLTECKSMIEGLEAFLDSSASAVAEAEELGVDHEPASDFAQAEERIIGLTAQADHHKGGAAGAKARLQSLLS